MKDKVIISGGDGFLGSHLAKYLVSKGIDVYALVTVDSSTKERIEGINRIHIIECDLNNYSSLISLLPSNPDAFFHFAWAGVSPACRNDVDIQKNNIDLAINAVNLASKINAQKFVFPGSTFEYLYSNQVIRRGVVPSPQDAYGATKIAVRYYTEILCNQFNVPYIYVVISGIYATDRKDNNVITYTIDSLLRNKKPSYTRLEQLWDYVYIDDVVEALYCILVKGKRDAFYVVGSGDNCPLSNYVLMIRDLINPHAELGIGDIPYLNEKIPMSCVDLTEINNDTGFIPHTKFEDGIIKSIEQMKKNMRQER